MMKKRIYLQRVKISRDEEGETCGGGETFEVKIGVPVRIPNLKNIKAAAIVPYHSDAMLS